MRVLIVDDDPGILEAVTTTLLAEGCDVDTARDGEEALAVLSEHIPNAILLDVWMPRLSGADVLLLARYFTKPPLPRIVGMTADPVAARELRRQGFRCLDKPFDIDEMLEALGIYDRPFDAQHDRRRS